MRQDNDLHRQAEHDEKWGKILDIAQPIIWGIGLLVVLIMTGVQ